MHVDICEICGSRFPNYSTVRSICSPACKLRKVNLEANEKWVKKVEEDPRVKTRKLKHNPYRNSDWIFKKTDTGKKKNEEDESEDE